MTEELKQKIIEECARRQLNNPTVTYIPEYNQITYEIGNSACGGMDCPDYLHSKDALTPLIEGLSDEELINYDIAINQIIKEAHFDLALQVDIHKATAEQMAEALYFGAWKLE